MAADILMPKLGLTMTEGLLAEWKVSPGMHVTAGQVLFVVETEKIATEIEAEGEGDILECLVPAGQTVPVGTIIGRWRGDRTLAPPQPPDPAPEPVRAPSGSGRIVATPLARRLARERGVSLGTLKGTGPRGRIKAIDVPVPSQTKAPAASRPQPLDRTRATAAKRLSQAKREIPHFYVGAGADLTRLLALRQEWNAAAGATRFTVTHAILAACGRALGEDPALNRVWDDEGWLALDGTHVGLAVDTPRGLFAPVLPDAGLFAVDEVARRAGALVERARDGALTHDDMAPASLTVSNVGMHGARFLVPIVNPGQSMILGVGATEPVFRPDAQGAPRLRQEVTLVLAADHRVMDGAAAARFLNRIVQSLEQPLALLRPPAGRS